MLQLPLHGRACTLLTPCTLLCPDTTSQGAGSSEDWRLPFARHCPVMRCKPEV